jgi:hypothetical protein
MVKAFLLIAILLGPQGSPQGVKVLGTYQKPQECEQDANRAVEAAKQAQANLSFSCVIWQKGTEA